jgi:hypothetical protein
LGLWQIPKRNIMGIFKNPWAKETTNWFTDRWGEGSTEKEKWFQDQSPQTDAETQGDGGGSGGGGGGGQSETKTALLCYGNGADLGDFSVFAKAYKKNHLLSKYKDENIVIAKTFTRLDLFNIILHSGLSELTELHIFSHSVGSGLFLGYHDSTISTERGNFISTHPNLTYDQVVQFETGDLLTDHLIVTLVNQQTDVQAALNGLEFAKFWGCNAGVTGHVYWDPTPPPYWAKLNDKNTPKPSIAQAFATYINKPVYGANSGSHIEFFINNKWVSGYDYTPKSISEYSDIRLHPDRGDYTRYEP